MQKTLLVLGASYSQIPLFQAARRLGIRTIAATIKGPYQGIDYADEVVWCDITKPEEVLEAIKDRTIDAVTTCCMDVGTRTMCEVAKARSLPGPGIGGQAATDKSLQKELFQKAGVRSAPYKLVRTACELEDAAREISFPVMVKAVDLMGSKGIRRADTMEDAGRLRTRSRSPAGIM